MVEISFKLKGSLVQVLLGLKKLYKNNENAYGFVPVNAEKA